jgi:hypothetical protein
MNKSTLWLFASFALVACSGGDTDPPADTDTDVGACDITIDRVTPADGATNVYYRSAIEWEFSEADPSATVTIDNVPGASAWVDDSLVFTPNAPLAPSTSYTWTLNYCDGANSASGTFTTSAVGAPATEGDLPGTTFVLDVASGRFVQPPGVGALLQQQLNVDILIGVIAAGGGNIEMVGALGVEDANPPTQDVCVPTIDFPVADFSENPYFEVGPQTTTLQIQGIAITIDDLFVSGAFAADGSQISGAVLAGNIDTRPLVPLVDDTPGAPETAVCDLVGALGVNCEACTGGGDFCLSLLVDSIAAVEVAGETIEVIETPTCP